MIQYHDYDIFIFIRIRVEGHPDKLCDQISDAVLVTALAEDPESRVAAETFTTTGLVVVGGEVTTKSDIPFNALFETY